MKYPELRRYIRHGMLVQLSVFEMVAELRSFTKAAQALHMAQPTVSMHVKKLTEAIGLPLFDQTVRTPQLTAAGRELHAACQDIFEKIRETEARLSALRAGQDSRLRLAVSTTAKYFAPRLLSHFWESNPGVEVTLMPMNRQSLLHRLEADLDDFYVLSDPPVDAGREVVPLIPNILYVYARDDHPLAKRTGLAIADLASEQFLLREPGSGTRLATDAAFAEHGIAAHVRLELGSNEAIKQAVLSGLGIAILSRNAIGPELRPGRLVTLDVQGFPIRRQWCIVHRKGAELSTMATRFLAQASDPQTLRLLEEDGGG